MKNYMKKKFFIAKLKTAREQFGHRNSSRESIINFYVIAR